MKQLDLVILGAIPREISSLAAAFPKTGTLELAGNSFSLHDFRGHSLLAGTTGIGKVNAAAVTGAILARFGALRVWNTGCAGAYRESGLRIGDVLVSRECLCGDEGVLTGSGIAPAGHIGIPLLHHEGSPLYDRLPAPAHIQMESELPRGRYFLSPHGQLLPCRNEPAPGGCFTIEYGSSLTVGMASGDADAADTRFRHHGALAENMEGSAIAQVCCLFGVPFLECRGISNIAGERDKSAWDFDAALTRSQAVVACMIDRLFQAAKD